MKFTIIELYFKKDKELLLLLENDIRGGISSVLSDRYVQRTSDLYSDENTKLLYIDANNLYAWAMSQYLPAGDFKKINF